MADSLGRFASDVARAAGKLARLDEVDEVVKRGVQNIKTQMNADLAASEHFKGAAGSVTYDSDYRPGRVQYEVGPDKERRGGALANIAYFGGAHGGGGTVDIDGPLEAEIPELEKHLGDMLEGLL